VKAQQSVPEETIQCNKTSTQNKALVASSSLPSNDFHVEKKLATGDLAAKFSSKTPPVENVSSTLGTGGSQQEFYQSRSRSIYVTDIFRPRRMRHDQQPGQFHRRWYQLQLFPLVPVAATVLEQGHWTT
jgi:hypothetical protein